MLKLYRSPKGLDIHQLGLIYSESIAQKAENSYGHMSSFDAHQRAESDFYDGVMDFFTAKNVFYAVWEVDGRFVAALRIEPYSDGLIVSGLEVKLDVRKNGYGSALISAVIEYLHDSGCQKLYSHVDRSNAASLRVHEKAGFQKIMNHAVFLDGAVSSRTYTLCCEL